VSTDFRVDAFHLGAQALTLSAKTSEEILAVAYYDLVAQTVSEAI
jgi:hypothetical protein